MRETELSWVQKPVSEFLACCWGWAECEAYLVADGINDLYLQEQGQEG